MPILFEDNIFEVVKKSVSKCDFEIILSCGIKTITASLEEKGVYVSAGSACASNHPQISGTLKAININKDLLDSTIRFSFSTETTKEEIEYALSCLDGLLTNLRKYTRH